MDNEKKDQYTQALAKAHEVTMLPILQTLCYTKDEVKEIIRKDRENQKKDYANYLRWI